MCFVRRIFPEDGFNPLHFVRWRTHTHTHTCFDIIYMVIFMETFQEKKVSSFIIIIVVIPFFLSLSFSRRENQLKQSTHNTIADGESVCVCVCEEEPIFGINASINMMFHIFQPMDLLLFLTQIFYTYFIFCRWWHIFRRIKSISTHFFAYCADDNNEFSISFVKPTQKECENRPVWMLQKTI